MDPRGRKSIGHGVYVATNGVFWARIVINRRRTWRTLGAKTEKQAIKEAFSTEWIPKVEKFESLAKLYLQNGCPDKRLQPRNDALALEETGRIRTLNDFFGRYPCNEIRLPLLPAYKDWRVRRLKRGTGERTVDKELTTLSNALNYGVMAQLIEYNHIAAGRPKYRRAADIKHCRESAPSNAAVIHRLAKHFFAQSKRSQVLGWQLLFSMFTGCRTSELLRLRVDAKDRTEPGFIGGGHLHIRRSKGGVNPFCVIGPEFAEMVEAFKTWRQALPEGQKSDFYFVNYRGDCIKRHALSQALKAARKHLQLPHITPHGIRSFYVTKRRSDGLADVVIAGEIGDKTSILMESTYGQRPPNWTGGIKLDWVPKGVTPAWRYFGLK